MGSVSNAVELLILDHILGTTAWTQPAGLFLGLSDTDPTDDGSGMNEPVGNNYSRPQFETWNAATGRAATNNGAILWPIPSGSWGAEKDFFGIYDQASGGTFLGGGALGAAYVTPIANKRPSIASGLVSVSLNAGGLSDYAAHKVLDHLLKTAAFAMPANRWLALATATITGAMTGATITEPGAGVNYSRTLANDWGAAAAGAASNDAAISTVAATGAGWGTITDTALVDDADTGEGNVLLYHTMDAALAILATENLQYAIGAYDVTAS